MFYGADLSFWGSAFEREFALRESSHRQATDGTEAASAGRFLLIQPPNVRTWQGRWTVCKQQMCRRAE